MVVGRNSLVGEGIAVGYTVLGIAGAGTVGRDSKGLRLWWGIGIGLGGGRAGGRRGVGIWWTFCLFVWGWVGLFFGGWG